jgi:hypothetical protein
MRAVGLRLGMPHSWVGKVETGERRIDVAEYVRLCRAIEANPAHGLGLVDAALEPYPTLATADAKAAESRTVYTVTATRRTAGPRGGRNDRR